MGTIKEKLVEASASGRAAYTLASTLSRFVEALIDHSGLEFEKFEELLRASIGEEITERILTGYETTLEDVAAALVTLNLQIEINLKPAKWVG